MWFGQDPHPQERAIILIHKLENNIRVLHNNELLTIGNSYHSLHI